MFPLSTLSYHPPNTLLPSHWKRSLPSPGFCYVPLSLLWKILTLVARWRFLTGAINLTYFSLQTSFKLRREHALRCLARGAACGNSATETENKRVKHGAWGSPCGFHQHQAAHSQLNKDSQRGHKLEPNPVLVSGYPGKRSTRKLIRSLPGPMDFYSHGNEIIPIL